MQLLQFTESLHHIRALGKFLSHAAELLLNFKVFLEIQVTELTVDFHHIIELLDIELICVIYIPVVLCRNRSHFPPSVLNLTELRECGVHILLLVQQGLEVSYDSLFQDEVVFTLLFYLAVVLRTLFLISGIKFLESCLYLRERIIFCSFFRRHVLRLLHLVFSNLHCKSCITLFLEKPPVKSRLDGLSFLRHFHPVLILNKLFEHTDKLREAFL